jgi:hypothetical protein
MKNITIHVVRTMLLLTMYVCCSSVVCCEASKPAVLESSSQGKLFENSGYNNKSVDEDITPLQMISIRVTELL